MAQRAPAIFVSHGAPTELIQKGPWQFAMELLGRTSNPRAVIVMSAHWRSRAGFEVGFCPVFETIHDFSGFPEELNLFRYPAKGDQDIANQCIDLLKGAGIKTQLNDSRGLDHGSYVPLVHMWSKANIPIVPIAIAAGATPREIFRVGEMLAPLRDEGVLLLGSGGLVHNLGELNWANEKSSVPELWAQEFQKWTLDALHDREFGALCDFREFAPHAAVAHPTWEHFAPLIFVAGAGSSQLEQVQELYANWTFSNLSMMCLGYGTDESL